jgi:hypothetical protein
MVVVNTTGMSDLLTISRISDMDCLSFSPPHTIRICGLAAKGAGESVRVEDAIRKGEKAK